MASRVDAGGKSLQHEDVVVNPPRSTHDDPDQLQIIVKEKSKQVDRQLTQLHALMQTPKIFDSFLEHEHGDSSFNKLADEAIVPDARGGIWPLHGCIDNMWEEAFDFGKLVIVWVSNVEV